MYIGGKVDHNDFYILTNYAIDYVSENLPPIVTPGYIGYALYLPKKYKGVLTIDYDSRATWNIVPSKMGKKFSKYRIRKILNLLVRTGWLEPAGTQVFPEFRSKLSLNMDKAIIIPMGDLSSENCGADVNPDDDISSISEELQHVFKY